MVELLMWHQMRAAFFSIAISIAVTTVSSWGTFAVLVSIKDTLASHGILIGLGLLGLAAVAFAFLESKDNRT
ncbi:MAG TPA: hypothetical protein VII56_13720 [Rhizomicrobium sp.]